MQELNFDISSDDAINQEKFRQEAREDIDKMISNAKKYAKELFTYDYDKMAEKKMRATIAEQLVALRDGIVQLDLGLLEIPFYELQGLKEIGQGGQAIVRNSPLFCDLTKFLNTYFYNQKVYKGFLGGEAVAVKMMLVGKLNEQNLKDFQSELKILRNMRSKYIIRFLGASTRTGHPAMVMEFMEGGNLHELLLSDKQLSWNQRLLIGKHTILYTFYYFFFLLKDSDSTHILYHIAEEIARGVNYIHSFNPPILHQDLKSLNILLDGENHCKVSDFGLAVMKTATTTKLLSAMKEQECRGTTQWMAPELFDVNPHPTFKSDMYLSFCFVFSHIFFTYTTSVIFLTVV
jgi:serine/threonine protein kinase